MNKNKPKRMIESSKEKKKSPILKLLLVVILIGAVVVFIKKVPIIDLITEQSNNVIKTEKKSETNNNKNLVSPIIYYSFDDGVKKPLQDDNSIWGNVTRISWLDNYLGIIKKDGQDFSNENNTVLIKDGVYEITVSSTDGKNKTTKTLTIDRTPPKVEIKKNASGTFTITFEDVNDVKSATLRRLDTNAEKILSEIDLTKNGLKKSIEIKEKGYYILEVVDQYGNWVDENREFVIR